MHSPEQRLLMACQLLEFYGHAPVYNDENGTVLSLYTSRQLDVQPTGLQRPWFNAGAFPQLSDSIPQQYYEPTQSLPQETSPVAVANSDEEVDLPKPDSNGANFSDPLLKENEKHETKPRGRG